MRQCERLAEIALELTEAARIEALEEFQPPAPRRYTAFDMPCVTLPEPPPFSRSTTFNDLVMLLSRCARQSILLESRIDSGFYDHPPPPAQPRDMVPHDADAPPRQSSDHTRIACERLDDESAADARREPADILAGIEAELATALDAVSPDPPALTTHGVQDVPAAPRRAPDRRAVTQADRARQHYLQQGTPPPPSG